MSQNTGIEWTDATWNPIRGCSRVSPGCVNCYAEKVAYRFSGPGQPYEGLAHRVNGHASWTGKVEFAEKHLLDPLRWKKPSRIFVNSMSDLFHENVPDEWIDHIFAVMFAAGKHTFQVLTKRPERMLAYFSEDNPRYTARKIADAAYAMGISDHIFDCDIYFPLPNVWLGVSVENREVKKRIDILREVPAALRFLSLEPLLEDLEEIDLAGVRWAIVGGESGIGARRMHLSWVRSIATQCQAAGVACFVKQLGALPITHTDTPGFTERVVKLRSKKGGDWDEWPDDLRVREFPEVFA